MNIEEIIKKMYELVDKESRIASPVPGILIGNPPLAFISPWPVGR